MSALLDEIFANQKKLDECPCHRFHLGPRPWRINSTAPCSVCGGEMRLIYIYSYVKGYVAHGGDPETVVPGWGT